MNSRTIFQLAGFILVGALNSLTGYVLYLLLLTLFSYQIAYTISYILGIFFSYYLNTRFVFRVRPRLDRMLQYPIVYLTQYILGIGLLTVLVQFTAIDEKIAPLLVVVFTIPITFILSRFLITR